MSGPGNPPPTFSFGSAGTTGGSNPFGQANNTSQGGDLFGSTSNPPASSGPGLFGSSSAAPTSNLFGGGGSAGQTSNPFAGNSGGSGAASGNVFGGASKPQTTGFNFGTSGSQPTSSATGTSTLFGGASGTSGQQMQAGTSTPAKPTFSFGNASTTPAGPPPASGGLFGDPNKPQEQKNSLFGSVGNSGGATQNNSSSTATTSSIFNPAGSSAALPASQPATSNLFGGAGQSSNLFSGSKPADNASTPNTAPTSNLFSPTPSQPASSAAPSSGPIFGALNTSKPEISKSQAPSLFPSPAPPADSSKPSLFPNLGAQSSAAASSGTAAPSIFSTPVSKSSSSTTKPTFTFPSAPSSQPAASSSTATPATSAPSLFSNLGGQSSSSATSSTPAPAPSGGLFNLGKPAESSTSTSAPAASSTSTAPAITSSLFGAPKAPAAQAPSQPPSAKAADNSTSVNLGASTSGPHPPAQSRLKNKSMDEIITRWASDLSKHTKEFHEQASKVSQWDLMLVENSDKIQKLYGDTLEAERATTEVERQLTAVENDQNELGLWLDHYEGEVNKMMSASQMMGAGETLMGPDKERDRTYRLAERLSAKLEEMGMDLGAMIEEINEASANLNKTSRSDDPLSQVVKVLNGHLMQLQAIDQGAAELQSKVTAAQQAASRGMGKSNGYRGPTSEAADGFYRSFMGRR